MAGAGDAVGSEAAGRPGGASGGDDPAERLRGLALIAEATGKAGLVWLELPGAGRAIPAWHVWHGGAAYVVHGGQEQPLPGLAEAAASASSVRVSVPSKDRGGRLVTWVARATTVPPAVPEWEQVAAALAGVRLNASDGLDAPRRWASESRVTRLEPSGELVEAPGRMSNGSGAAAPPPTAAATAARLPFVLGRRRARRQPRGRRA